MATTRKLAQAEAALGQAQHDLADAEFRNDVSTAGQAKLRGDLHAVEVQSNSSVFRGSAARAGRRNCGDAED